MKAKITLTEDEINSLQVAIERAADEDVEDICITIYGDYDSKKGIFKLEKAELFGSTMNQYCVDVDF